ncbi:hypothetical protein P879_04970 [Paragonimus westermani]|uniref:SCP domain-containing protein n=1 Tax=Paragonimus westermani TaxID=34504 RepID=A0A8T0DES2_9TREM|nr:hypothetical protein P879_04970 [Paragonimus westermani]
MSPKSEFINVKMQKDFNEECITEHNRLRALHGCPKLTLDENLARGAQEHAKYLAQIQRLEHTSGDYGENLVFVGGTSGVKLSGAEATKKWYKEIKDYRYENDVQLECGHFTQVIWKETTCAGFGRASNKDGTKVYAVGRYYPPGNFEGQCIENVPKPLNA